jgi:hypothetical protein
VHGSIVVVHLLSIVSIRLVDVKCVPAVVNVDEQRQRAEEEFRLRVVDAPIDDVVHVIVYSLSSASTTWLHNIAILFLSHHDHPQF